MIVQLLTITLFFGHRPAFVQAFCHVPQKPDIGAAGTTPTHHAAPTPTATRNALLDRVAFLRQFP
ncbi:hypothetical protein [Sodalis sp. dw_96]|uniref:hypothetical protein n=1 Tax=Sodalis sp. dw_96 TaxID=2719794 RepID=UPI001BD54867|nr:hypothetical protein [Sodalis sp. dw_96]